jgi:hypothetical protein
MKQNLAIMLLIGAASAATVQIQARSLAQAGVVLDAQLETEVLSQQFLEADAQETSKSIKAAEASIKAVAVKDPFTPHKRSEDGYRPNPLNSIKNKEAEILDDHKTAERLSDPYDRTTWKQASSEKAAKAKAAADAAAKVGGTGDAGAPKGLPSRAPSGSGNKPSEAVAKKDVADKSTCPNETGTCTKEKTAEKTAEEAKPDTSAADKKAKEALAKLATEVAAKEAAKGAAIDTAAKEKETKEAAVAVASATANSATAAKADAAKVTNNDAAVVTKAAEAAAATAGAKTATPAAAAAEATPAAAAKATPAAAEATPAETTAPAKSALVQTGQAISGFFKNLF